MFKELKENMSKEVKERIRMMSHQIENIRDRNYRKEPIRNSRPEKYYN